MTIKQGVYVGQAHNGIEYKGSLVYDGNDNAYIITQFIPTDKDVESGRYSAVENETVRRVSLE